MCLKASFIFYELLNWLQRLFTFEVALVYTALFTNLQQEFKSNKHPDNYHHFKEHPDMFQ